LASICLFLLDTGIYIQYHIFVKTITVNVSELVYREFQQLAKSQDRTTSELIREAMQAYRDLHIRPRQSLKDLQPLSLGKVLKPLSPEDDLLGEMLNA
jgi:hypothetical protein